MIETAAVGRLAAPGEWAGTLSLDIEARRGRSVAGRQFHDGALRILRSRQRADLGWDPRGNRHRRHILGDHGIGTHRDAMAKGHIAQHLGAGADRDAVAQRGMAFDPVQGTTTEGGPVIHHHVITHLSGLADDDAHAVVDEEALADLGSGVDLHAGRRPGGLRQQPGRQPGTGGPQAVREPVHPNRVQARRGQRHLDAAARRWVTRDRGVEVATDLARGASERTDHHCGRARQRQGCLHQSVRPSKRTVDR